MPAIIIIGQFILGFFQIAASAAGLEVWLGLPWLIALPLVFLLSYFSPIISYTIKQINAINKKTHLASVTPIIFNNILMVTFEI